MKGGLAIFVKTPALSPIKTRLANAIGVADAETFHRRSADAVASVALQAQGRGGAHAHWAIAEHDALQSDVWAGLPTLAQGEGGLGERMRCVYQQLLSRHGFAILLGADSPQLCARALLTAAEWLASPLPRLVVGPASDGGFWLFGGNVALPDAAWTTPTYSHDNTRREFVDAMADFGQWLQLETLSDVDRVTDLPQVHAALEALPQPTPEQRALTQWLAQLQTTTQAQM